MVVKMRSELLFAYLDCIVGCMFVCIFTVFALFLPVLEELGSVCALFPGKDVGPGFSLSGRALALVPWGVSRGFGGLI